MTEVLRRINASKKITLSLKIISHASTLLAVLIYALMLYSSFLEEPSRAVALVVFPFLCFVFMSLLRKLIDAPRPYEEYDFCTGVEGRRRGSSFPSRHVFSAFIIGTVGFCASPSLAVCALMLGAVLAAARVLLCVHYVRDVLFGAAFGVFFGALGLLAILI